MIWLGVWAIWASYFWITFNFKRTNEAAITWTILGCILMIMEKKKKCVFLAINVNIVLLNLFL